MTRPLLGRGRPVTLLAATLAVAALGVPSAALAHAELDTMTPGDASTVTEAPPEIVATFTEALDPSKSSIVLVTAAGAEVATGGEVAADDPKKMRLTLPTLEPGVYEIRWTSASAEDGDLDRGRTTFTYAPAATPSATPTLAPSATPAPTQAATASASAAPAASPSPSGDTQPAASSTTDVLIPIIVAVILVAGLGYWLLRGRSRSGGTP